MIAPEQKGTQVADALVAFSVSGDLGPFTGVHCARRRRDQVAGSRTTTVGVVTSLWLRDGWRPDEMTGPNGGQHPLDADDGALRL